MEEEREGLTTPRFPNLLEDEIQQFICKEVKEASGPQGLALPLGKLFPFTPACSHCLAATSSPYIQTWLLFDCEETPKV